MSRTLSIADVRRAAVLVRGAKVESVERGVWDVYAPDGYYWADMECSTLILTRSDYEDTDGWQDALQDVIATISKPLVRAF